MCLQQFKEELGSDACRLWAAAAAAAAVAIYIELHATCLGGRLLQQLGDGVTYLQQKAEVSVAQRYLQGRRFTMQQHQRLAMALAACALLCCDWLRSCMPAAEAY